MNSFLTHRITHSQTEHVQLTKNKQHTTTIKNIISNMNKTEVAKNKLIRNEPRKKNHDIP